MKHVMQLEIESSLSEMKEIFPDNPLARFTYNEETSSVICWDRHEIEDVVVLDNGCKHKLKKAGKAFKVTYEQAIDLFGATFTDQRGCKRLIPSWTGMKSSFMVLPS